MIILPNLLLAMANHYLLQDNVVFQPAPKTRMWISSLFFDHYFQLPNTVVFIIYCVLTYYIIAIKMIALL